VRSGENGTVLLRRTKSKENLMFDREHCSLIKSPVAGNRVNKQRVVPEIDIHIAQHSAMALLDTGSEVSCISEEVWAKLTSTGIKPPTLPITSIHLRGAIGQRSCHVVIQCYLEIVIDEHVYSVVAVVV
jgi:hypothetical protein